MTMINSKPPSELSLDELRLLLSIAEGPSLKVSGSKLLGAGGRRFRRLRDLGALARKERVSTIVCQECDRRHRAIVTLDRERQTMTYFCSEAGRVAVDPEVMDRYALRLDWLLNWLAGALRIPVKQQPIVRIDGHLWELGEVSIEGQRLRLLFALQIGSTSMLERVDAALDRLAGKGKSGIVLTASSEFRVPYRLPSAFSVIDIEGALEISGPTVSIDRRRLASLAEAEATVDLYKSGSAGRPTAKKLYMDELDRRIRANIALLNKRKEAAYLQAWLAESHPDAQQPSLKTVMNNIVEPHLSYRSRRASCPK